MFGDGQEQIPKRTWIITIIGIIVVLFVIIPKLVERTERNSDNEIPRQQTSTTRTEPSTISSKEIPTESSTEERLGSRKNPAQIGDTMTVKATTATEDEFRISVTLLDVVRGAKATQRVVSELDFYSTPPDGKEYVIATFQVSVLEDLSGKDKSYSVRGYNFELCDSTYVKTSNLLDSVTLSDYLAGDVYEGGSITGTVVFTVDINEDCYAVLSDYLWFALPSEELIEVFIPKHPNLTLHFDYGEYEDCVQYNNGTMYFMDSSQYEKKLESFYDEVFHDVTHPRGESNYYVQVSYLEDLTQITLYAEGDYFKEYGQDAVYIISGQVYLYHSLARKEHKLEVNCFDVDLQKNVQEYVFDEDYPYLPTW